MEKELEDGGSFVRQHPFELPDVVVPPLPDLGRHELPEGIGHPGKFIAAAMRVKRGCVRRGASAASRLM